MTSEDVDVCNCKIGRLRTQYGLTNLNEELKQRWIGDGREEMSLRDLERYVNKSVLRNAMEESDLMLVEGEVDNKYRILTDEDVSAGNVVQLEHMLEREGVDVNKIRDDFVSHQTVYNHLRNCLGVEKDDSSDEDEIDRSFETIRALQNKTGIVTKKILQSNDVLSEGEDFDVIVDIVVIREDGQTVDINELKEEVE